MGWLYAAILAAKFVLFALAALQIADTARGIAVGLAVWSLGDMLIAWLNGDTPQIR